MKISVAQTRPVKGEIRTNIECHKKLVGIAAAHSADIIIFPELSLTGYEPQLAKDLATSEYDSRFDDFQKISDEDQITIGVGMPTKHDAGICITMIIFQPHEMRQTYSKKYLHADEESFFISGNGSVRFANNKRKIALAICYELSVPQHAEDAFKNGAEIYIASVAKSLGQVDTALERLSEIARKYSMTVLMSNCVGLCDGMECGGRTSIWNNKGFLQGQLNDLNEGILIIDTDTGAFIEETI